MDPPRQAALARFAAPLAVSDFRRQHQCHPPPRRSTITCFGTSKSKHTENNCAGSRSALPWASACLHGQTGVGVKFTPAPTPTRSGEGMGQRDTVKGVGAKGGMLVEVHHGHSRRLREDFALASEFFDVIIPSHREACAGLLLCQEPCPPAWGGAAMRAAARAWGGRVVGLKRLGFSVCRRQRRQQRGAFVPRQTL